MYTFVTIVHIFASLVLVLVVLLQAGKGANMGAAFGGARQTGFWFFGGGDFFWEKKAGDGIKFFG